jgi:hypothetical protein
MQGLCCPRCSEGLSADPPKAAGTPAFDGWEMDEQLRHIGRVLESGKPMGRRLRDSLGRETVRIDAPHAGPADWYARPTSPERKPRPQRIVRRSAAGTFLWSTLSLGTASFACGGILLGWSAATGRQELWTIGLPAALVGQIMLLVGLVLQLDRLWHENRAAAAKLDDVDEQLSELKTAATLLGTSQGPAAGVFYSHFAGGASPQLLLTDLKSQIDLLAMRIAQDER